MGTFYDDIQMYGNSIALQTETDVMTYEQLASAADEFGDQMQDRCLVFCMCKNNFESVIGYIGCLRKEKVALLLNEKMNHELFMHVYNEYRPQYVWAPTGFVEGTSIYEYGTYALIQTPYSDSPVMHEQLAILLNTSGSTGSAKLVRQTYENVEYSAKGVAHDVSLVPNDHYMTTMPMSHVYGFAAINANLVVGARVVLNEYTLYEQGFWKMLKEKEVTGFSGVPFVFEMLEKLHFWDMDLPALRFLTEAGAKMSEDLQTEFAKKCHEQGVRLYVIYGATESTCMSYIPPSKANEKIGSIGIPSSDSRFEIIDDDGNVIDEPNKEGELVFYGKSVSLGYAECRDDLGTEDAFHGRLETGDIGKRDEDGYYYIVGRKKRFMKLYGNRVNLMEVEALLAQKGFETACVGEDGHTMNIYTTAQNTEAVQKCIADLTGINRLAFHVTHIDSIPRSDTGKVLYSALQKS